MYDDVVPRKLIFLFSDDKERRRFPAGDGFRDFERIEIGAAEAPRLIVISSSSR